LPCHIYLLGFYNMFRPLIGHHQVIQAHEHNILYMLLLAIGSGWYAETSCKRICMF
jgi:hypothetical protein